MDHGGRIVDWSPRATELFGWTEEEAVGATMSSMIIPHRHRADHETGLKHFLRSGEGPVLGKRMEVPAMLRSGEEIPVELFIRVLHADDGEPPLFAGFIRDIREQKRASDQLIAANSRLSALIRSTSSGILVLNDQGTVTLVNDPFREMFGIEPSTDHLLGADGIEILHGIREQIADAAGVLMPEPALSEGDDDGGVEEFTLHDGRIFERECSTVVGDDQVLGQMWQFRDITERRRTEAAVRRARNAEVRLGGQIQELFLRGRPPERHPHLDIAVLSVPSQGLDGDFVDFIQHGTDHLDVVVGDVMGKGLAASLLGAATKNSFSRALTSASRSGVALPPTTEVVSRVHDALARRLISVDSFVTLLYSRLDLAERVFELVGCGHPGVIHYSPATQSHSILEGQDPPLGFVKENAYSSLRVPFELGDLLVFYSDGITEAFSPEGEMLGVDRLLTTIRVAGDRSAASIVQDVRQLIDDFTGLEGAPKDDLTLVVIRVRRSRVHHGGDVHEMLVQRGRTRLFEMRSFLQEVIAAAYPAVDAAFSGEVVRAAQEAVTNAMRHARPEDPDSPILVRAEAKPEELIVEVRYDGVPFEPDGVSLPDLSTYPEGGFGLFVIENSVDEVSYGIAADGRSLIRMVKRVLGG
jgi:PAS domain S-box-containing protein